MVMGQEDWIVMIFSCEFYSEVQEGLNTDRKKIAWWWARNNDFSCEVYSEAQEGLIQTGRRLNSRPGINLDSISQYVE